MSRKPKETFLQRKHTVGQQAHERKDAQHHSHKNANQNYNEVLLHTSQNCYTKKSTYNKSWTGCGEKGTFLHCWWECKLVKLLCRTLWRFLKKLKIDLPYNLAIQLLGIYLDKTIIWKNARTPMLRAATFKIAKTWKQPKCPLTNEQIKKIRCVYIQCNITKP